jgi:cell division protease FtsH
MAPQQEQQKGPPQQQMPRIALFWWIVLIALLIWNIITFWPRTHPRVVDIPYTVFLSQVRADNVSKVQISGDKITGSFIKPFLWPQTASTSKNPSASPQPRSTQPGSPLSEKGAQSDIRTPTTYTEFTTTFPQAIGDPNLLPLLEAHRVTVNVEPPPSHWFTDLLVSGLPVLLLMLFFFWMGRQAVRSQSSIFSFGRTKAKRYTSDHPGVTFNDVAGADEAKGELQEVVDFLRHPQKYHELGARIPRGVLLVGPPGTGKTLLARAVAGEAGVPFFSISASEFVEMFVGVGASRVRDLFNQAKMAAPSIVFIDELDAVGRRRGAGLGTVNDEREQTLNQLLVEMDGFNERQEVIIMSATNRPDVLDPALLRPGRFDRQVTVALPDREGREGILRIHTRRLRLAPDVDLSTLARSTLDKVLLGGEHPRLADAHERRVVAYHETGHALVAWLTPAADPVHKITIVPHGRALGVTKQLPGEDRYNYSRTYLIARLAVMLGGRTAEEIVIGDVTTGAEMDLVEATRLARRMVTRWGMSNLGPVAFSADEEQPFIGYKLSQERDFSEATAARIDQEVQRLLDERHEAVRKLLTEARNQLDLVAETLLKEETINQEDLVRILGPRPGLGGEKEKLQ